MFICLAQQNTILQLAILIVGTIIIAIVYIGISLQMQRANMPLTKMPNINMLPANQHAYIPTT